MVTYLAVSVEKRPSVLASAQSSQSFCHEGLIVLLESKNHASYSIVGMILDRVFLLSVMRRQMTGKARRKFLWIF